MSSSIGGRSDNIMNKDGSHSDGQPAKAVNIDLPRTTYSAVFLADGKHIVSGGAQGNIQHWRVEDGKESGMPMDVGRPVWSIAVSRNKNQVVSGTDNGEVTVWSVEGYEKVIEFTGHINTIGAMDVSRDGTRIVTGSFDHTACIWSVSSGKRLLGPLEHDYWVAAVKLSSDERYLATATWNRNSVRIYDSQSGSVLVNVPIKVGSYLNQSLAWTRDSKQLFVFTLDGSIHCLDASSGATRSRWPIHSASPECIILASDDTFIAASTNSSVSFWDTKTHKQVGSVIQHTTRVRSMAISANYDLAICGGKTITLWSLRDILPSCYHDSQTPGEQVTQGMKAEGTDCEETVGSSHVQGESSSKELARREEIVQQPRDELSNSQCRADSLNDIVESLRAQEIDSSRKIAKLEETVQQLRDQHSDLQHTAAQEKDSLNETIESLRNENSHLKQQLHTQCADLQSRVDILIQILRVHEQKHQFEIMYAEGRILNAAVSLLELIDTISEEVKANKLIMDWLTNFKSKCILALELIGDEASCSGKQDEAFSAYSTALSLHPSFPNALLAKWARTVSVRSSTDEVLRVAAKFDLPKFDVYRAICNTLERSGHISEAVEYFRQAQDELGEKISSHNGADPLHTIMDMSEKESKDIDERKWAAEFRARCVRTSEQRGDSAIGSASYIDAILHYTTALTLDPLSADILVKRSKARAKIGSWEDSLEDAQTATKLNPSSPYAYEAQHVALLGAQRYDEAIGVHSTMLVMLEQSLDLATRELRNHYVSPPETMAAIRKCAEQTQSDAPLVLVHTENGRLYDREERLDEFKADSAFKRLVASMTRRLDDSRITQIVREYFRYATFSHTWEGAEPLFHDVLREPVHDLKASPTVFKLMMLCVTVREAGLRWAWSDTCCINKTDSSVLQESLTSMFRWYHESALTIVHLKGVLSDSELGALERCLWNMRAWTLQEFFASRVIRFYTEDWKPYHPDESTYNHKDSLIIMREMAAACGVDIEVLLSLRPGSENVRQKLCLAATRMATRKEDIAYSLFGIFDVSVPVNYGEGQQRALGQLLEKVLTRSGDVTILAWTGKPSEYNSCLPAEITVYRDPASPYIPSLIEDGKMDALVTELRKSLSHDSAAMLYDQVILLQSPRLFSNRLSLPCIKFRLSALSVSGRDIYHATTPALGGVEIRTAEDLYGLKNLILVHPWLKCLLDTTLRTGDSGVDDDAEPLTPLDGDSDDGNPDGPSLLSSHAAPPSYDKLNRSLRLFARLRQPFGALLLAPLSHSEYKRVASDQPIVVQLLNEVSPRYLARNIQTLDIL